MASFISAPVKKASLLREASSRPLMFMKCGRPVMLNYYWVDESLWRDAAAGAFYRSIL